MAEQRRKPKTKDSPDSDTPTETSHQLRSVPKESSLDDLFSGTVSQATERSRKRREKKKPIEALPEEIEQLSNIYAAGKSILKEIDFKVRFAEQRVKEYCLRKFTQEFARTGKRPSSIDYTGEHSRFTFVQTGRITLNFDKVDELRRMQVPIDEYTELRGIKINYQAIRQHGLEEKLRQALASLGLPKEVLEECFVPDIQPKEEFFDVIDNAVENSLSSEEKLDEKLYEVIRTLGPSSQVRNLEAPGLDVHQCLDLVLNTEVAIPDESDEFDAA